MSMPFSVGTDYRLFSVAENVTRSLKVPVYFLNITRLSEFRKDAHTSVHTIRQGKMLTPEQQADPNTYADCIHWCLPGLPDTWNEFLYTRIISRSWPKRQTKSLEYLEIVLFWYHNVHNFSWIVLVKCFFYLWLLECLLGWKWKGLFNCFCILELWSEVVSTGCQMFLPFCQLIG